MHNVSGTQAVPLETYGGLVTLARAENAPEGASPRNYNMDFLVGSAKTRDPLQNVYSYAGPATAHVGTYALSVGVGPAWTGAYSMLVNDGTFANLNLGSSGDLNGLRTEYLSVQSLQVSVFGFNVPATTAITGISVSFIGFGSGSSVNVSVLKDGVVDGVGQNVTLSGSAQTYTVGGAANLLGSSLWATDVNNPAFGIQLSAAGPSTSLAYLQVTLYQVANSANDTFVGTFTAQDGTIRNLVQDANGNLFVENVTSNPGVLSLAIEGITPGSFVSAVNGPDVEYMAFNDLTAGCDVPRQYTPQWVDRISQVGPGAAPVFSASTVSAKTYPITGITQPAAVNWTFAFGLQSAGPGSTQPGNVVTQYYADSTVTGQDTDLVNAFNSGQSVYLHVVLTSATSGMVTPDTVLVTSVGIGYPPGQARQFYYFTYSVPTQQYIQSNGGSGYGINYQRTLATLTTSVPVPLLTVGSSAVVSGNSVTSWNATWPITQTLDSGAMVITQSSLTAGVATYSYSVSSGANPVPGQSVTITGTLNANGTLNVVQSAIASVSGTNIGTFTVGGFQAATDYPAAAEQGQATTAGNEFTFEPGVATLGTGNNPIYGNGTGGIITVTSTGQFIGAGTRQGTLFFITRNGYYTAPAPPVTFTTPNNTTAILASQILIGPPNVIARGIAFTEAGQNGVPGANFFTIPTPIDYLVQNVSYTASSLIINDNTSTTASFFFTDSILLNATAIDVQGNNLFNLIELGNPGWIVQYDSRNFYGLCQNKVQNFLNMSFDGGYLPRGQKFPSGWTAPDEYGQLQVSPVFGNSYYINNTSGATQDTLGRITQPAYQDAYNQPILQPNTAYSIRVTARIPSGNVNGALHIFLVANGLIYGSFAPGFNAFSSEITTIQGELFAGLPTIPQGLQLDIHAHQIANGADIEIDRIEIFPSAIPILTTTVFASYAGQPEAVDGVTGVVKFTSENQQPVNGAVVMYDTFYALKNESMYSLKATANLEPSQWEEPEVAQRAGACGINAYDFGEQWIVEACRNGLYLFDGGQPGKIMQEIYQIWDAINWNAGKTIWVRNDVTGRRMLIGVPLPTPNFWLPDEPVNANPTTPNVILMLNYQGCDTGEAIKQEMQLHTTMFGSLNATDMKRKWSIWPIPCPYAGVVSTSRLDQEMYFCNGIQSSKIYRLNPELPKDQAPMDDGVPIRSLYTTYGFVDISKAAQMPILGMFRKLWSYLVHQISGFGMLTVRLLPNILLGPTDSTADYYAWTLPGGFQLTDPCTVYREAPLNFAATKTFLEFSTTGRMQISNVTMNGKAHVQNKLTGQR